VVIAGNQASDATLEELDRRAFHHYVNGLLFEGMGDLKNASLSFEQASKHCEASIEIGLAYARSLTQLKNFTKALQTLNKLDANNPEALVLKGLCFRRLGDPIRAKQTYLDLTQVDSTSEMAYMFLASFYQRQAALDSAVWAYKNLVRTIPNNHEVLNELGKAQLSNQNPVGAREAFRMSLSIKPARYNMDAVLRLGDTFELDNQPDSTRAMFEVLLEEDPNNTIFHRELARSWLASDSTAQALPHMWAVASLNPEDALAQRRLAIILIAADSLDQADSILTSLVEAGDSDPSNHFYLSRIGFLSDDYARARDELKIVTKDAAGLVDGWLGLGFAYRRLGLDDEEIDTYRDGLMGMANEASAIQIYFALGAAFERTNQVDSAIAAFEQILDHQPDHAATLNYLGYALADRGLKLDYARELISQAVKIQPNNPAFLDSFGWVYYRLGDFEAAVKYLSAAAELDSDPVIYDHFGDALQAAGKRDQAREWWQKALEQQPENQAIREKLSR
jgi:tetratricopeptide (TPR) repeat protein